MRAVTLASLLIALLILSPVPPHGETAYGLVVYVIDYPSISPNGDGIKDSSPVEIEVFETLVSLLVTVEDRVTPTILDTLLAVSGADSGLYTAEWKGIDYLGAPLGEGNYTLHIRAIGSDTTEHHYRTVTVDLTAPVVAIDRIEPGVLTPGRPGATERSVIYFTIADYGEGDSVTAAVTPPDLQPEDLPLEVMGDGSYTVEWGTDETAQDGVYIVMFEAHDLAGNRTSDEGYINVDTEPPAHAIVTPIPERTNEVPAVLVGWCWDRNGMETPELIWQQGDPFPPDRTYEQDDTLFWEFDIGDSVTTQPGGEDSYRLDVRFADRKGWEADTTILFTVDLIPPAAPVLAGLPARIEENNVEIEGTIEYPGTDTIIVYRIYAAQVADTERRSSFDDETFSFTYYNLEVGVNEFYGEAADEAGNRSAPSNTVSTEYVVETEAYGIAEVFREPDYFRIRTTEVANRAEVILYSLAGAYVMTLAEQGPATEFEIYWDLRNDDGEEVRNGAYVLIVRISHDGRQTVEKSFIAVVR